METKTPQRKITARLLRMSDPGAQFDEPVSGTMAERLGLVWELTLMTVSLEGKMDPNQPMQRHVTRLIRSEG